MARKLDQILVVDVESTCWDGLTPDGQSSEMVCSEAGVGYPFGISHLNVKSLFAVAHGLSHEVGLDGAYAKLGMTMERTHHRGDDDAWNIARVLCKLLRDSRTGVQ